MRLALALAALLAVPAQAAFNPVEFFRGHTHGDAMLKVLFHSPQQVSIDSHGSVAADGGLVLKQLIRQSGKADRIRTWRLREDGPDRFSGTLTDADGPVRIDVEGDHVRIRYRDKDHLSVDQMLTPAGPREVENHMSISRFGIVVAHLDEVIRKLD